MTVKDLYDWAVKNKAENLDIRVAYYGYGGSMIGEKDAMSPIISEKYKFGTDDELILTGKYVLI